MKKEDFLSLLGDIDDKYIKEAADFTAEDAGKRPSERRRKPGVWLKYGSLAAACLVLCIAAALLLPDAGDSGKKSAGAGEEKQLPTLSVEQYAAKVREPEKKLGNPSAARNSNPWEEDARVETLPVFENVAYAGSTAGEAVQVSCESLGEEIRAAAESAGLAVREIRYTSTGAQSGTGSDESAALSADQKKEAQGKEEQGREDGRESGAEKSDAAEDSGKACKAVARTDNGTIMTTSSRFTKVEYEKPIDLPEEYTAAEAELTEKKAEEITEYLLDEYGGMMNFSNPKANVYLLYDEDGKAVWNFAGYDGRENLQEQIVSYNLKQIHFQLDETGRLAGIVMMDKLACGKKIEEYPIMTAEEAKKLLVKGEYVASSEEAPSLENIEEASLVYLAGPECSIFMPYYAFDVRVDEEKEGLIHYSTYYVPAVREEYLDKMPGTDAQE